MLSMHIHPSCGSSPACHPWLHPSESKADRAGQGLGRGWDKRMPPGDGCEPRCTARGGQGPRSACGESGQSGSPVYQRWSRWTSERLLSSSALGLGGVIWRLSSSAAGVRCQCSMVSGRQRTPADASGRHSMAGEHGCCKVGRFSRRFVQRPLAWGSESRDPEPTRAPIESIESIGPIQSIPSTQSIAPIGNGGSHTHPFWGCRKPQPRRC